MRTGERRAGLVWLSVVCVWLLGLISAEDCSDSSREASVAVVVASLGRSNADGDPEDLSWLRRTVKKTKDVFIYQRSRPKKKHYIATSNGNECLTYMTYITENYHILSDAVIFVHADAKRHCPLISDVLQLPNEDILQSLTADEREVPGYLAMSKVFFNQSRGNLEQFKYPLITLSNYILHEKYAYQKYLMDQSGHERKYETSPLPPDRPATPRLSHAEEIGNRETYESKYCDIIENTYPFTVEYPDFITTYTSGSFMVTKENILKYPLSFYEQLRVNLFDGGRTCGYLEYLWSTMWGGEPFSIIPDKDRSCGPLFYTDISKNKGFEFIGSDDGSVEAGKLPDGYHGHIMMR